MIRIGTAGWTYDDWAGIVYPEKKEWGFQPLTYLAGFFDTIEINSTFYRPPAEKMSWGWVEKVRHNKDFKFTAKLWQGFTHDRDEKHAVEEKAFKDGIRPLMENGLLGALLIQFPYSYKFSPESMNYVASLLKRFMEYPLVVEVRHASFESEEFYNLLKENAAGFCNIDQPVIGASLKPSSIVTSDVGYIRFHGRNYKNWFAAEREAALRYDYLYSSEEMKPWIDKIKKMAEETVDLFIIQNNHFRGKGACNALEMKSALTGKKVLVPEPLLRAFKNRLAAIASNARNG
ncbi:MAG: DUF72 domain-containing protein [Acidobacteriota bacterium]